MKKEIKEYLIASAKFAGKHVKEIRDNHVRVGDEITMHYDDTYHWEPHTDANHRDQIEDVLIEKGCGILTMRAKPDGALIKIFPYASKPAGQPNVGRSVSHDKSKAFREAFMSYIRLNTKMPYDKWYELNEAEINIELAENGADREMDFDSEKEFEKRYENYLNN